MEAGPKIFLLVLIGVVCFLIYDDLPGKYTNLEESFEGFMNKSLVRFESEKSQLHTIFYGVSKTGKTNFIKQYLNLYSQDEEGHKKKIIVVCEDEKEWINPETGMPYEGLNMCRIDITSSKNID